MRWKRISVPSGTCCWAYFSSPWACCSIHAPVARHWWLLLVAVAAILLFKTALIAIFTPLTRHGQQAALRTGLVLAQGGEFGFALLSLGLAQGVIHALALAEFSLAVIVVSMLVGPLLIRLQPPLAGAYLPGERSGGA